MKAEPPAYVFINTESHANGAKLPDFACHVEKHVLLVC